MSSSTMPISSTSIELKPVQNTFVQGVASAPEDNNEQSVSKNVEQVGQGKKPVFSSPVITSGTNTFIAQTEKTAEEAKPEEAKPEKSKNELSDEEKEVIQKLVARDLEVKAHEQAHIAASGGLAGSPSYTYQIGPDGQQYAIGGEVQISTSSKGGDPRGTIAKMEQVKKAALAPAEPSGQDISVASRADAAIRAAEQKLAKQENEDDNPAAIKNDKNDPENDNGVPTTNTGPLSADKDAENSNAIANSSVNSPFKDTATIKQANAAFSKTQSIIKPASSSLSPSIQGLFA